MQLMVKHLLPGDVIVHCRLDREVVAVTPVYLNCDVPMVTVVLREVGDVFARPVDMGANRLVPLKMLA